MSIGNHFQLGRKGIIKAKDLRSKCHFQFNPPPHFIIINSNRKKKCCFPFLHSCTDRMPSAAPFWSQLMDLSFCSQATVLAFSFCRWRESLTRVYSGDSLLSAKQKQTCCYRVKSIQIFKRGHKTMNSLQQKAFCSI